MVIANHKDIHKFELSSRDIPGVSSSIRWAMRREFHNECQRIFKEYEFHFSNFELPSRDRLGAPRSIRWATRRELHSKDQRILTNIIEFQFSNSNRRRVRDFALLEAFGGPRDVNSITKIKESSRKSMNFNSQIRIAVA